MQFSDSPSPPVANLRGGFSHAKLFNEMPIEDDSKGSQLKSSPGNKNFQRL
jgi:hypothetical protein